MEHDQQILSSCERKREGGAGWTYKTLLVPVDARKRSERSVGLACALADRFDAHVIGLHIQPIWYVPPDVYAYGTTAPIAEIEEGLQRVAEEAHSVFNAATKRSAQCSLEWRSDRGDAALLVQLHARYADLVIINQADPEAEDASHFADTVLLTTGRPTLLVPYAGKPNEIGTNILVCWNASHEAARAVTDAMPFLQSAGKVTVMSIDARSSEAGHGAHPGADIALFLARHGVRVEVMQTVSAGLDEAEVILSRAADEGADLIVMGAYGHTRIREIVLGGATRTMLRSMTVPVLMSH